MVILTLSLILISVIYVIFHKSSSPINIPKKIIIYKNGNQKILDNNDKNFNIILQRINSRLNNSKNIKFTNDKSYVNYMNKDKRSWECIELIYDKPYIFKLGNNSKYYTKIFFTLRAENSSDYCCNMALGDLEYSNVVRGLSNDTKIMNSLIEVISEELNSKN